MKKNEVYCYPMKMQPVCKDYLWGGERLKRFNKKSEGSIIAESWEVSCNEAGLTKVADGTYKGKTLKDVIEMSKKDFLGESFVETKKFPLLVKLIDANKDLSVQVHPTKMTANEANGESCKSELWYIVDCDPNSYIYLGFNKDVSKEEFMHAIQEKTVCKLLNKIKVKKGEAYYIPAGTIHALGGGILVAEIQQNSNTTFRVYDYDRKDFAGNFRELHVERAKDVLNFNKATQNNHLRENFSSFECGYFKVKKETINKEKFILNVEKTFQIVQFISGNGKIIYENDVYNGDLGDTFFVPAKVEKYVIKGECGVLITKT